MTRGRSSPLRGPAVSHSWPEYEPPITKYRRTWLHLLHESMLLCAVLASATAAISLVVAALVSVFNLLSGQDNWVFAGHSALIGVAGLGFCFGTFVIALVTISVAEERQDRERIGRNLSSSAMHEAMREIEHERLEIQLLASVSRPLL